MRSLPPILFCLLAGTVFADSNSDWEWVKEGSRVQEDQSFGHQNEIWSQDHSHITGWKLSGENGHSPDVFSDRIMLTPPSPGNRRAAMWAERPENNDDWNAEFEFRATGQERGSGNLQLWYAKDGSNQVDLSSIYTVGKFDGLAVVISQYGGRGGSVRGFLNDGTISMKHHHGVDRLAFGHCDFSYRNLGRFAHIGMKQTPTSFEVTVDHKPCFTTDRVSTLADFQNRMLTYDQIKLPSGYYFGITAASAENPDSFETKGFIVSSKATRTNEGVRDPHRRPYSTHPEETPNRQNWYWISEQEHIKDQPASTYKTDETRFQDLHDRISMLSHALDVLYQDLSTLRSEQQVQYDEIMHWLSPAHDHAEASRRVLGEMERMVKDIRNDVQSKDYRETLNQLHNIMKEGHATIATSSKLSVSVCDEMITNCAQLSTAAGVIASSSSSLLPHRLDYSQAMLFTGGELIRGRRSTCDSGIGFYDVRDGSELEIMLLAASKHKTRRMVFESP